uniref:biotin/lipoyl-containing protein n=1 Tax=uncultured Leifsonia sp. TaxID=340359 RepID=UPI0028D1A423
MNARVFALPDLGEGLTDAELVRWLVAVGDTVAVDQPIAEVETAKSVVEVPTPFAGVVAALHGAEGETVLVGAPLLEVSEEAPTPAPEAASPEAAAPGASGSGQVLVGYGTTDHATTRRRSRTTASSTITAEAPGRVVPVISPVVRSLAHRNGVDIAALHPSGAGGVVTRRDVEAAIPRPAPAA